MPFEIVRNDISNMHVDAIVNAASRYPWVHAGVDMAIHKKAGPELLAARMKIGFIHPGSAAITPAFNLDARYVIHAATPTWQDGMHGEPVLLRDAYRHCLKLAVSHGCESIAFPLLAAGNHGFPKQDALDAAIDMFTAFLREQDMQIYLVVYETECVKLSEKLVQNVRQYIDEHDIRSPFRRARYSGSRSYSFDDDWDSDDSVLYEASAGFSVDDPDCFPAPRPSFSLTLDDYLREKDAGFTETLLQLIKKRGLKNSAVYKKANISKQHFSKIINDPHAKPSKPTAIALAIALELNLEETRDLISRAGYALNNSSTFDLIIRYFIEQRNYNIIEINITLYDFDQSLLGS